MSFTKNMSDRVVCHVCSRPGTFEKSADRAEVHSNVGKFKHEKFTVWRCSTCKSIHSKEAIDLDYYYKFYPNLADINAKRPSADLIIHPFERPIYNNRLRAFSRLGFRKTARILDYGCNRGAFPHHLREKGYLNVFGYDRYHKGLDDASILQGKFDVITLQDVVEHLENPIEILRLLADHMSEEGVLIIGTPNADEINLNNSNTTANFELHQPYHRTIFSENALIELCKTMGLRAKYISHRSPFDSMVPFMNGTFLANYVFKKGNVVDSVVSEPVDVKTVALSPKLLLCGLFGYFLRRVGNMSITFSRT